MAAKYDVSWTTEAKTQVDLILDYLKANWSEIECENFLDLLVHFERTISFFPKSFKKSNKYKGCRLGYIHKHITAIYKISRNKVSILTIVDNRSKIEKW